VVKLKDDYLKSKREERANAKKEKAKASGASTKKKQYVLHCVGCVHMLIVVVQG
jgi:hypothetical protein